MLLEYNLPPIVPQMINARVLRRFAHPGDCVKAGDSLLEIEVDISELVAGDCPAISYYRLILREPGIVRVLPDNGAVVPVGERLALLAQAADDPLEGVPSRRLRLNIASILPRWDEMT